jgi:hypothetical protein
VNPKDFDIGILRDYDSPSNIVFWTFAIIGVLSIIFARVNNTSYISTLFTAKNTNNKKTSNSISLSTPLLLLNFAIAISLQLYLVNESFAIVVVNSQFKALITIFFAVVIFFFLKTLLQYIVANSFLRKEFFELKNAYHLYQIAGLILLPLALLSIYQSDDFKKMTAIVSIIFVLLCTLYYWYVSLKDSLQYKISLFYIFLYLCTLEILPLLILAKYLLNIEEVV